MRIRHLRVRIKELASEATHIRHEASQTSGFEKWELNHHRTAVVRPAARRYLLAYAFMRGRPYRSMEPKVHEGNEPNWKAVAKIVTKFGGDPEKIEEWAKTPLTPKVPTPITALADGVLLPQGAA
jgi:hypothetical protein